MYYLQQRVGYSVSYIILYVYTYIIIVHNNYNGKTITYDDVRRSYYHNTSCNIKIKCVIILWRRKKGFAIFRW